MGSQYVQSPWQESPWLKGRMRQRATLFESAMAR